jgi:DNA-binding winged helix-turn-helix (wHTH) protein/TolB-like protein/Flp pilus assembly protein TadD
MPRAYRFDQYCVDLAQNRVTGPDGVPLAMSSRAYEVLVYLIDNRTRVVSKDDLLKAVWPRVVVEENNLTQAISALRRALGDMRDASRFIITVPGRGYRFVGDVKVDTEESAARSGSMPAAEGVAPDPVEPSVVAAHEATLEVVPEAADATVDVVPEVSAAAPQQEQPAISRRWLLAGIGGMAVAAAVGGVLWSRRPVQTARMPRSIAVLPFKPLVEQAADQAMELGIAETLINRLSSLPDVTVTPLSSVRRYADSEQDPLAAGRDLDVAAVIEGHVQFQPDRVRLTARLLDVQTGAALWSGSFDEKPDDYFALQDSLARQIVDALSVELSHEAQQQLTQHYTESVEAWQLYLNGRFHWNRRNEEGLRKAIQYYEAAERVDPRFALPAAGLADAWAVFGVFGIRPPGEVFPPARVAAERAISLDSRLAEAQAALGHILVQQSRDWVGGERQYRHALKLKPTYAQGVMWLGNNHAFQGRLPEALVEVQHAQSLEPMSVAFAANVGLIRYFMRDFDAALAQLAGLVEAAPQALLVRNHLGRVYCARGEAGKAVQVLEGHPGPAPGSFSNLGRAYALDGQLDSARREIARVEDLGQRGFGVGFDLAIVHAALGEREPALAALERGEHDMSQMIGFLNSEPGLDSIRDEPRFRAVSQRLRLG